MAENNNTENSNIAEILQAIINGSSDYPEFKDNPPSRIALLLMLLGNDISAIKEIVANLPDPLVPKGTLGTGEEDLPDLPDNPSIGDTYFVSTAGTYGDQVSNIGDMFYFNANDAWSYVPTGDVDTWRNVFVNGTEVHGINNKDALRLVDSDSVKVNFDGVNKAVSFKTKASILTGTLFAGQTMLTITDEAIKADSIFNYWTSIKAGAFGISPTDVTATTGSLTLTFPAQATDMIVKVEVE